MQSVPLLNKIKFIFDLIKGKQINILIVFNENLIVALRNNIWEETGRQLL